MLYQVVFRNKSLDGIFIPIEGRTIFTSVAEAKTYMAVHAMYPVAWRDSGSEDFPAYGRDDRTMGFEYMMVRLSVFGNDAVVVPTEKIAAIKDLLERMERRLIEMGDVQAAVQWIEGYPGQSPEQIADHKMDGDLDLIISESNERIIAEMDEDYIVAAAERKYERDNDTPTERRSDLD